MKHFFWILANVYGFLFGWPWLRWFHHMVVTLSLHALGYDNSYRQMLTGEQWFVRNILKKSGITTCLDIGANVGNYAELLRKELNATIYAIEPARDAFEILKKRFADRRSIVLQRAIADYNGEASLFIEHPGAETATLDANALTTKTGSERVRVSTLDAVAEELALPAVDFVKIDTEGFEREVIRGGKRFFENAQPRFIQFEFNVLHLRRGYTLRAITELLPEYDFYRLLPHGWVAIDPEKYIDNIFVYCNIVARRR